MRDKRTPKDVCGEAKLIDAEVQELLKKGAIQEVSPSD